MKDPTTHHTFTRWKVPSAMSRGACAGILLLLLTMSNAFSAVPYPAEILQQQARLTNSLSTEFDDFGRSVDIRGNRAVVGGNERVDVFERSGPGNWMFHGSLSAYNRNLFGPQVALEDGLLAVSAVESDETPLVYIYEETGMPGLNAWNTTDHSSGSGVYYRYNRPLTPAEQQVTATEGWTLTIRARMADDFGGSASAFVDIAHTNGQRFLIFFDLGSNGDLLVQLNGLEMQLTTNGLGWLEYHTHQIVFDPSTGTADYFFDGQKKNPAPWSPTPIAGLNGVRFGNGSTAGMGSINFNLVELKTHQTDQVIALYDAGTAGNPTVAPDPETVGWDLVPDNIGVGRTKGPVSPDLASEWHLQARIALPELGPSLALSGNTLVVGTAFEDAGGTDATGAARVFVKDGTNWVEQQVLVPSVRAAGDYFGLGVAVDGDTIVVGAPHQDSNSENPFAGRAFVFVRNGTNWTEQALLEASDKAAQDAFGVSVAVDGDRVAVGAEWDDHPPANFAGSVYVFERTGSTWSEVAKVFPQGTPQFADEGFGRSVALSGRTLVVGGFYYGAHWVFSPIDSGWTQVHTRVYTDTSDPAVHDVSIDGETFIVGVASTEVGSGAAYVYGLDYSNIPGLSAYVQKLLYYPDANEAAIPFDPNSTAFRYKHLLYAEEAGGVRPRHDQMSEFYGPAERELAQAVEEELLKGLRLNPDDPTLGNLLLDIRYDRTVAETILAKDLHTKVEAARFGPPLAPPPAANGFIIDNEIPIYRQLIASNKVALETYFSLLTDHLGIPGDPPRGYQIFQDLVPGRGLTPATYTNSGGMHVPVIPEAMLFSGYKDLVLLFELLREHGRSADNLARLLISRNGPGDRSEAETLVGDAERFLFLQGTLLKNMFTTLPPEGDPSGLAEAIAGWSGSLRQLGTTEQLLKGGGNVLGFADDFMMYVQKFAGQTELFDSYDALRVRLDPNTGSNPLQFARDTYRQATNSYAAYRGFEDQLAAQFDNSSITYRDRLRDIVGVFPEDEQYSDNPTNNPGSELDQQYRSIEVSNLRIERNQTEISNLRKQVQIEMNKAANISNVVIRFGNQQAQLTETIGSIEALQAECNALAAAFSPEKIVSGLFVADIVNGAAQGGLGIWKATLEGDKERLAALQQATITGIESEAVVKTLLLQMNTLAIDSREAALLHQQEVNRLVALYREKEDLEQKIAEQDASVTARFFADPVHRLAAQADMIAANLAFEEARKWLYFMARALEYKWNPPFRNFMFAGRSWSTDTLFKLRNAVELEGMYHAMDSYESQIQLPKDDYFDWFSVRDDFFGYKRTNLLGQASVYVDPVTGATVDALTAFRSRLSQLQDAQGNIILNFSTVTEIPGGTFFRGPRFNAQGQVISKGLFLDKIRWLKINLPGTHTGNRSQLAGELRYGGTAFIRNFDVGTFDPQRPDRLRNELTAYSTRYWFFYAPSNTWRFTDSFSSPVTMQLSDDPRVPPSVQELDVFKERSVATSGWVLTIPTKDAGQTVLNISELEDVEIYFFHYAVTRP